MMNNNWRKLSPEWEDEDSFGVFGFGDVAHIFLDVLREYVNIAFIIDNKDQENEYDKIPVFRFEDVTEEYKKFKIIIMAETLMSSSIAKELEGAGYIENVDFTYLERFLSEWFYLRRREVVVMEAHTAITTRCIFNCANCNMFMPYYKQQTTYSFEELRDNIDVFFKHVDFLFKYQLLGGEPFINPDFKLFLRYLKDMYGSRIGKIRIVSNGGILPTDDTMEAIKYANAEVMLSDYTESIPYHERYHESKRALKSKGISVQEIRTKRWRDVGFPNKKVLYSIDQVAFHTKQCGTAWHGLIEKKLFFCNSAWSAEKAGLFCLDRDDYIDLDKLEHEKREIILQLCLGEFKKGYHSFCRVCGGMGEDNAKYVKVGEQVT